jgi:hypothetical protein
MEIKIAIVRKFKEPKEITYPDGKKEITYGYNRVSHITLTDKDIEELALQQYLDRVSYIEDNVEYSADIDQVIH